MAASIYLLTACNANTVYTDLVRLLDSPLREHYPPLIVGLMPASHPMRVQFEQIGVPVCTLDCEQPRTLRMTLRHLVQYWRKTPPPVLHGWSYGGNLLATWVWLRTGRRSHLMWSLPEQATDLPQGVKGKAILWLNKFASRYPKQIMYHSNSSLAVHQKLGFATKNAKVLPHETAIPELYPIQQHSLRVQLLKRLHLKDDSFLVGCVARYEPELDINNLLHAAANASLHYPTMHWLLAGFGMEQDNAELSFLLKHYGLEQRVHLLGDIPDTDLPRLVAALDLATLTSRNTELAPFLVEAMAHAIPVVSTALAGITPLVTATGTIVPHQRPERLASAWGEYYEMSHAARRACGLRARQQVLERYNLQHIVDSYQAMFTKLCDE